VTQPDKNLGKRTEYASPNGTTSSTTACPFCGAPALRPNRKARRQGVDDFVMLHASWCRIFHGSGTIQPGGYIRRPT
jgi:hypothetical protein